MDPDGDPLKVVWLYGDGRRDSLAAHPNDPRYVTDREWSWRYADNGTYLVSAIVADDSGAADTASLTVTILNSPPDVSVSIPAQQAVGTPASIQVEIVDPGAADWHTVNVRWGDGTSRTVSTRDSANWAPGPSDTVVHTFATPGTYSITVSVQDDDAGADSTTPSPVVIFDPAERRTVAGYEVIDLGTLGGNSARPADINNHRQIVGTSLTNSGAEHAFLWDDGDMHDLGTLGHDGSEAVRINDAGAIAGTVWTNYTGTLDDNVLSCNKGTIWQSGVGRLVETRLDNEGCRLEAGDDEPSGYRWLFQQPPRVVRALTGSGDVVWASGGEYNTRGWFWRNGSWQALRTESWGVAASYPTAVNDRGQVVGAIPFNDGGIFHGFVWEDGSLRKLPSLAPRACATYGDCSVAVAMDINGSGQIVGISTDATEHYRFVLWDDDQVKDLGAADWVRPQRAPRIVMNSHGKIAGSVAGKAFFWGEGGGGVVSLPSSSGSLEVVDINDEGEVAGTIHTGTEQHAFVWSRDRGLVDLGTGRPGLNAAWVVDINGRGDVVGYTGECELDSPDRCTAFGRSPHGLKGSQVRAMLWRKKI